MSVNRNQLEDIEVKWRMLSKTNFDRNSIWDNTSRTRIYRKVQRLSGVGDSLISTLRTSILGMLLTVNDLMKHRKFALRIILYSVTVTDLLRVNGCHYQTHSVTERTSYCSCFESNVTKKK
jgi:hypothetical protein